MKTFIFILALLLPLWVATAAIQAPGGANLSLEELEAFRAKGVPDAKWPALLETLGNPENTASVKSLVKETTPFPAAKLVELLSAPRLAVRLGALDLLEDAAGDTMGFNPWQEDPTTGPNADALARWKTWAEKGSAGAGKIVPLTTETFRAIAQSIISGNRDSAERAMQRLDAYGLTAIAHIECFLNSRADLEVNARAALRLAQYRVVLMQTMPKQAAALARSLATGTAEAQSTALSALNGAGPTVLPIIADFIAASDPLVRETAVDAAFGAGGGQAVPLVLPRVSGEKPETAESVLHAILRGLGKHGGKSDHAQAIAKFLKHADENVVISALEAIGASSAGSLTDELAASLEDSRWRVRAATLEAIMKRKIHSMKSKAQSKLTDADLFVRVTAAAAVAELASADGDAVMILEVEFLRVDDLKPAIVKALFDESKVPSPEMWAALHKAPPEIILQCLDVLDNRRDDYKGVRIPFAAPFARHPNKDVSAAALRLLASRGRHSALLLEALNSGDSVKQDAVLDQLHLPPDTLVGAVAAAAVQTIAPTANSQLDALYQAFANVKSAEVKPAPQRTRSVSSSSDPKPPIAETMASPTELRATLDRIFKSGSPRQKFVAALSLSGAGDVNAIQFLLTGYDTFSPLDRRSIAGSLHALNDWPQPARELGIKLLRDEAGDVREGAIGAWMEHSEYIGGLLGEYARKGSTLGADDVYGYQLDRLVASSPPESLKEWVTKTLVSADAADAHKVMAIVLAGRMQRNTEDIVPFLQSKNQWLRRAAYRSLGAANATAHIEKLLADESANVRAVIPFLTAPHNYGWMHHFDDASSASDDQDFDRNSYSGNTPFGAWSKRGSPTVDVDKAPLINAVEKLLRDPSDHVRFEAMFALMRLSRPVDPNVIAALLPRQPESSRARLRVANFVERNYTRLGKAYGVLVPLTISSSDSDMPKYLTHFGMKEDSAFTSFAALAALAPKPDHAADTTIAPPPAPKQTGEEPFRVVFFHKAGCKDCDRVREMLADVSRDFPKMLIDEREIGERTSALLNEALCARFGVKDTLRQVAPAIFTQAGAIVKSDITPAKLGDFLRSAVALAPDAGWAQVAASETTVAAQTVEARYSAFSFGAVALAGLLDGINPCAFATIIFLLSYLHIARRTPREILAVGVAFISAVFIAYFVVGLGIAQALTSISGLRVAGTVLNYVLAAFALIIAVLSFRDAQLAARGELSEMTLQLPGMLKDQIRGVIRTGAKATRFVVAAFAAGIVISFLELACTGQVYLPTIQYMLKAGHGSAVRHLAVYNTAFIIPLVIVFTLAFFGLRSDALIRFQKNHTSTVKVLTGLLFVALAVFLLFGRELLAG